MASSLAAFFKTLTNPIPSNFATLRSFSSKLGKIGNGVEGMKYRKQFKGRIGGVCHKGSTIAYGEYGLQALQPSWITSRQIEAGRRAMTRNARGGKFWVRVFAKKPVTEKPAEVRMGRGKGNVAYHVAVVKANKILYEVGGVPENIAKAALKVASSKMPVKTRFVSLK